MQLPELSFTGEPGAIFECDDGGALVLSDCVQAIDLDLSSAVNPERALTDALNDLEAAARRGHWVALAADYGLGAACDPATRTLVHGARRLRAWCFSRMQKLSADALEAALDEFMEAAGEAGSAAGVADVRAGLGEAEHAAGVEAIKRWITDGECYQINLTFPLLLRVYGEPLALFAKLRRRQPVRYGAFISAGAGQGALLSRSPELFFERTGRRVVTRPMKGTAARGATAKADEAQRIALQTSTKERAENIMIVDLLRNDLGRLADPGLVRVDSLCATEAYPTLWQLVSTVSAEVPDLAFATLFKSLFPCGSITGTPKIRAMQLIDRLENDARKVYTGAIGYLAPDGDCRLNVAIRTLEIGLDGRAQFGVGSGIVIDAEPAREYAECLLKARFLTGFDPGFELIETLRLENGTYPHLDGHLRRLSASAGALGFSCDPNAVLAALNALAGRQLGGLWRVRLTLSHAGMITLTQAPLNDASQHDWKAILAPRRLLANDPLRNYLRRHKTSVRARYDAALAEIAGTPEVFDVLFLNTRGEVCEGARSTVFVERDGRLLTPPLASGCLAGVLRAELLASGRAVEQVLYEDDLRAASALSALYLGNALRGLRRVTLAG